MQVFRLLFWNIDKTIEVAFLNDVANWLALDVICLAECELSPTSLEQGIEIVSGGDFSEVPLETPKLSVFARPTVSMSEYYSDLSGRLSILKMNVGKIKFLVAVTHLQSKVNTDDKDRYTEACIVADQIRGVEEELVNDHTILCGDLNMNPFADGVVAAKALHAIADKEIVRKRYRTIQKRAYPFFYNPMWGLLGDTSEGPPGTHYHRHSGHVSYEWNTYDQVLLRPACLQYFNSVSIITQIGETSIALPNGRPDRKQFSDHFPILVELEVPNG